MSALRAAARAKPVIVMKAGRFSEGGKAAVLHTGALVGSDDVFDAALNRAGVVWVQSYAHFFAVAESLHMGLKTNGPRLAIVANDGGPGVIAADFLVDRGLPLAVLSSRTRAKLDAVLPKAWSGANPVDVHGDASAERYATAVEACLEDDGVDGVLAILVPQALTEPLDVAQAVAELARPTTKPVLSCWMGQASVGRSREHFRAAAIPTFSTPETAIDAFAAAAAYPANQELLLQVPRPVSLNIEADRGGAKLIIESALASGRTVLDIIESKAVLAAFGVPIIRSTPAHEPPEAVAIAEEIGFPVVVKIHSPDITHKSDVGGVRLGVANGEDVRTCSSS